MSENIEAPDTVTIDPIETVTVEASRLVDWGRLALVAAIWLGILSALERR